jgi:hypothetical protein
MAGKFPHRSTSKNLKSDWCACNASWLAQRRVRAVGRRRGWQLLASTRGLLISGKIFCTNQVGGWWTTTGSSASRICTRKGMVRNHCLARAISDAGWSEFRRQLAYKGTWYGTQVVAIDRFCPSSKTCSDCGYILPELDLSIRAWVCPDCGAYHDRDLNAAVNIKNEALSRAGIARIHAGGESVRPTLRWQFSQKPEAQCLHCPADAGQHG